MVITFCGHSSVPDQNEVRAWLQQVIEHFIYEDELLFYLGGYGGFDRMAASVVREKKKQNPNAKSALVIPYLNRKYDEAPYDHTVFPPLESVPLKFAISRRNEWMVSEADVVIAYVTHGWGGAATTLEYAKSKKKQTVLYPELPGKIVTSLQNTEQGHTIGTTE